MDVDKLHELHGGCSNCKACGLHTNGHKPPLWYHNSQYVMLMEQPSLIVEKWMTQFWNIAAEYNLKEEQFMQIHTVQCKTGESKRHTKRPPCPAQSHRSECRRWVTDYMCALEPKKMIAFGNIAMQELTGHFDGILKCNGTVVVPKYGRNVVPTVLSVSPFALAYRKDAVKMIRTSLQVFKEL